MSKPLTDKFPGRRTRGHATAENERHDASDAALIEWFSSERGYQTRINPVPRTETSMSLRAAAEGDGSVPLHAQASLAGIAL